MVSDLFGVLVLRSPSVLALLEQRVNEDQRGEQKLNDFHELNDGGSCDCIDEVERNESYMQNQQDRGQGQEDPTTCANLLWLVDWLLPAVRVSEDREAEPTQSKVGDNNEDIWTKDGDNEHFGRLLVARLILVLQRQPVGLVLRLCFDRHGFDSLVYCVLQKFFVVAVKASRAKKPARKPSETGQDNEIDKGSQDSTWTFKC